MSSWETYLALGGNEIINNERARGIAQSAACPMAWFRGPYCRGLASALGDDSYSADTITDAPWFDPDLPNLSSRFYGAFAYSIDGVNDSTRAASVTEGIDAGGRIGRVRKATRRVRVKALLVGKGLDAIEYGQAWMSAALDPGVCGQHGDACGTADLAYFVDCPPTVPDVPEYGDWVENRRNLVPNPALRVDAAGWSTSGLSGARVAADLPDFEWAYQGSGSGSGAVARSLTGLTVGLTYSVAVQVEHAQAAYLRVATNAALTSGVTNLTALEARPEWTTVTGTFVAAASTMYFGLYVPVGASGATYKMTAALAEMDSSGGGYFDGDTPPTLDEFGGEVVRNSWAGAEDASQSVQEARSTTLVPMPEAQYQSAVVDPLRRYLHDVAAISGPLITDTHNVGDFWAYEVEIVFAAERPWVYGVTRDVDLPTTPSTVVEDIAHNLAPYPSAELDDGVPVLAARNLSTNPSLESATTGWSSSQSVIIGDSPSPYWTLTRTQERFASGTWSLRGRILGNSVNEAGGIADVRLHSDVTITGQAALGARLSFNIWAAAIISDGEAGSEIQNMEAYVEFRNGGTVLGTVPLGSSTEYGGHPFTLPSVPIPATATVARVVASYRARWGSTSTPGQNSDIRFYADALAVTVP